MFNCGNCELVVGKQMIITHFLQLRDIVKPPPNLDHVENHKDGIFNIS